MKISKYRYPIKAYLLIFIICIFSKSGFCTDLADKELRSSHFIISYNKEVNNAAVSRVKDLCEQFYRQITQEFNLVRNEFWLWENRAKVYIAKNRDEYLQKFHCPPWSNACVDYDKKLIYTYPNQEGFAAIFAHELAHIIFREYIGKKNLVLWLNEGVALYVENKYAGGNRGRQLKALGKIIRENEYIFFKDLDKVTVESLNARSQEYVDKFYLQSFSIVHLLIKNYGKFHFSKFLSCLAKGYTMDNALKESYFSIQSIDKLEAQWKKFYQS